MVNRTGLLIVSVNWTVSYEGLKISYVGYRMVDILDRKIIWFVHDGC